MGVARLVLRGALFAVLMGVYVGAGMGQTGVAVPQTKEQPRKKARAQRAEGNGSQVTSGTKEASAGKKSHPTQPEWREGKQGMFPRRHAENLARAKKGDIDLLFIGDSITDRWSSAPKVWNKYFGEWKPANFGIGGDRTQNVLWRIDDGELDGLSPKVVVLMIGTNNTGLDTPEDIVAGIKLILHRIHTKMPKSKVLLLGIFPRNAKVRDGREMTMQMDKIRVINESLSKGKFEPFIPNDLVRYLDISDAFLVDGKVPKDIMPDGLHPNEKGYEVWAKAISPVLKELMEEPKPAK